MCCPIDSFGGSASVSGRQTGYQGIKRGVPNRMVNRIQRTAVGASAVVVLSLGLVTQATANHGPNCDQPREDVVAFLEDNMDEWQDYDDDLDGIACEATHQLTKADITGGDDGDEGAEDDDGADDDDSDDDDITVPTEVDTGR